MKNETAKITVATYLDATVNHAAENKMPKVMTLILTIHSSSTWMYVLVKWKERRG